MPRRVALFVLRSSVLGAIAAAGVGDAARASADEASDGGAGAAAAKGPWVELGAPPPGATAWPRACSARHPLCVAAAPGVPATSATAALAAAERAWGAVVDVLGLPSPDPWPDATWNAYLVDGRIEGAGAALPAGIDPVAHFDRAASFGVVDGSTPAGCTLELALARAVATGALLRAAPATDPGSTRAEVESIAHMAVPCAADDGDEWVFQASPERAVIDPSSAAFDRGASLFFDWLDATLARRPAGLMAALWALAPTRTPPRAARWSGAPTGFDVLRVSLKDGLWPGSTLDDALVRFSVFRATHDPPARLGWHVPWPDHPRRFAAADAPAPTGASYVAIDGAGAPAGAKLHVEAAWEDYGRMRWVAVKLDAAGRITAEWPMTAPDRATSAALTIEELQGADRILVVGVDTGSTEHPFDPDQGWWEPHAWLLTVEPR